MNIKEASEASGLSADSIRYYERVGLIPAVPRDSHGIRIFSERELNWIEFARRFRAAGMSVEALAEYIRLFNQGDETIPARLELIIEERDRLQEKLEHVQQCVDRLNHKIEYYTDRVVDIEKDLASAQFSQNAD